MTSDLNLFRQRLANLQRDELKTGHLMVLHSAGVGDYARIVAAAEKAHLIGKLIEELHLLEHKPSEFVKRYLQHE